MSTSTISSARSATTSCSSSPTQPIQIGFSSPSSTMTRPRNTSDASIVFGSPSPSGPAAFPSWKLARPQLPQGPASSYFSDEDLFGDDEVAYLNEAPEPPRTAEQWSTSKRGMAMAMAANASLVTLDSSCESYNSFGFSNGYTPSKPIMMKK